MNYIPVRRTHLARDLKADGVDAYLVTNPVNVQYLSGFTGSSACLAVTAKSAVLVSDSRYEEQIKEECPGLEVHIRPHDKTTAEAVGEVLGKLGGKSVGVEAAHLTLAALEGFKEKAGKHTFVPVGGRVEALRSVKDPAEVELIRAAVTAAERAFGMFAALIRETDTEKDLADAMDGFIRRAGGKGSAFPPIVAVGERGALPHAPPTARTLHEASKLLVDWGADVGYKSDITRTCRTPFAPLPTRKSKQERTGYDFDTVYEAVRAAQAAAVAELRAGATGKEVDTAARKVLAAVKLDKTTTLETYFTHGLGHGLGLETHEAPQLRQNSDAVLKAGNVVTIEPGVYLPGWGGVRLEDDYLITRDGAIRLTTLPHDPDAIR